jgi:lysophospholipase L1-like esterase
MMPGDLVRVGQARLRGVVGRRAQWWWLGLPIVPLQGYRLIRTIPRFADADGATGRVGTGDRRMRVVALGDSVAAGYAVAHHRSSVAGQLAVRLADRYDATVEWQACAMSGATAGQALDLVSADTLVDADLVFVSIGVNDLKNLHSTTRFRRELHTLLDAVLAAAPRAQVCLLGIPPLDHFPAFPRPLADALGWRGRVFDAIGVAAVHARERAFRIESAGPLRPEMFAGDGFHPSPTLHAAFADAVMASLAIPTEPSQAVQPIDPAPPDPLP